MYGKKRSWHRFVALHFMMRLSLVRQNDHRPPSVAMPCGTAFADIVTTRQ
jgi:hypothetical protein